MGEQDTDISELSQQQGRKIPSVEDEDLLVWLRVAISKDFKKIHRKIKVKDDEGNYGRGLKKGDILEVDIETYFKVQEFDGQKHVVVTDVSRLGGQNHPLWYLYLVTGILSGVAGVFFLMTFYNHV